MKNEWPFVTSDEAVAGTTPTGKTYLVARALTLEQLQQAQAILERALAKHQAKPTPQETTSDQQS